MPLNAKWSDVGDWSSLHSVLEKDANNNALKDDVICYGSSDNLISTNSKLVAPIGVQNLTTVETKDAVLVASKDPAQGVKHIVNELKSSGRVESDFHPKVHRP